MPMRGGARQTPRILGSRGLVEEAPKGQRRGMCHFVPSCQQAFHNTHLHTCDNLV